MLGLRLVIFGHVTDYLSTNQNVQISLPLLICVYGLWSDDGSDVNAAAPF